MVAWRMVAVFAVVWATGAQGADCTATGNAAAQKCLDTSGPLTPQVIQKCRGQQQAAHDQCVAAGGTPRPAPGAPAGGTAGTAPGGRTGDAGGAPPGGATTGGGATGATSAITPATPPKSDPKAETAAARARAKAKADAAAAGRKAFEEGKVLYRERQWAASIARFKEAEARLREADEPTHNIETVALSRRLAECDQTLESIGGMPIRYDRKVAYEALLAGDTCRSFAARLAAVRTSLDQINAGREAEDDPLRNFLASPQALQPPTPGGALPPPK